MKICEIELSEKEIERLKKCHTCNYCSECDCVSNCIVDFLYSRVNSSKYTMFDFFLALEVIFNDV